MLSFPLVTGSKKTLRATIVWLLLFAFLVVIDQLSKRWAFDYLLQRQHSLDIFPWLAFHLSLNRGVGFGLLSGVATSWFLIIVTTLVTLAVIWWWWREVNPLRCAALVMIVAGAIGNIIDRIRFGGVIDFIDVYWQNYHWPTFNIADVAITVGVAFMLLNSLFMPPDPKSDQPS